MSSTKSSSRPTGLRSKRTHSDVAAAELLDERAATALTTTTTTTTSGGSSGNGAVSKVARTSSDADAAAAAAAVVAVSHATSSHAAASRATNGHSADHDEAASDANHADVAVNVADGDSDGIALFKTAMAELAAGATDVAMKLLQGATHELHGEIQESEAGVPDATPITYKHYFYLGLCWSQLAGLLGEQRYFDDAISHFEHALQLNPEDQASMQGLSQTLVHKAIADEESLLQAPSHSKEQRDMVLVRRAFDIVDGLYARPGKTPATSVPDHATAMTRKTATVNDVSFLEEFASALHHYSTYLPVEEREEIALKSRDIASVALDLDGNRLSLLTIMGQALTDAGLAHVEAEDADSAAGHLTEAVKCFTRGLALCSTNAEKARLERHLMNTSVHMADVCPDEEFDAWRARALEHLSNANSLVPGTVPKQTALEVQQLMTADMSGDQDDEDEAEDEEDEEEEEEEDDDDDEEEDEADDDEDEDEEEEAPRKSAARGGRGKAATRGKSTRGRK
ncbi:hypothetical protein CAOG_06635 [Capsaspora owczarzaki ATCC 30864]|uniref:Uncharacterized protein n=1 Tax=Capsaspora owczarzaki (strain ATCC 30864) TaxID=595528 RepID=A0A0D2VXC3_CAPO3|nr:hypothetical protein CAOG_06635 [Capsaspora owczarzaki ATCC 30864]KJE96292.1 hypothetical protein CAOG_006635 [Capsaspora owczarzaki ATCC 30864]|eukprot:XP_004344256.1 hypothetical protein CAOG_06635 [Capsaspora owczarzaki ATCC 30864]